MTLWRTLKSAATPARSLLIEQGRLYFYRANGALTMIELDDLEKAELRVLHSHIYWLLTDKYHNEALIPDNNPDIGYLRRYLAQWRGFNYDGLLRFDSAQQSQLQLWPIEKQTKQRKVA